MNALIAALVAVYGFCSTDIQNEQGQVLETICTDVVESTLDEPLLPRCAPWARARNSRNWTFVNGRSRSEMEEKHHGRCDRVVPLQ